MFLIRRQSAPHLLSSMLLAGLVLGSLLLTACSRGEFSGLETLPVGDYVQKPDNFLGNTYQLTVQIDSQIVWEEGVGRILAVLADGSSSRVPVFVPDGIEQNLHVGQRYRMRVNIRQGGLIYVENLRKF